MKKNNSHKLFFTHLLFIFIAIIAFDLCACKEPDDNIVGKWQSMLGIGIDIWYAGTYTFNADGTGTYGNTDFRYTVDKDLLEIWINRDGGISKDTIESVVWYYRIEGNKLILKDSEDDPDPGHEYFRIQIPYPIPTYNGTM